MPCRIHVIGGTLEHPYFEQEVERPDRLKPKYLRLRDRYPDMSPDWWFDTHRIDVAEINEPQDE